MGKRKILLVVTFMVCILPNIAKSVDRLVPIDSSSSTMYLVECDVDSSDGFWTLTGTQTEFWEANKRLKRYVDGTFAWEFIASSWDGFAHGFVYPRLSEVNDTFIKISNRAMTDYYPTRHRFIKGNYQNESYVRYYTGQSYSYSIGNIWTNEPDTLGSAFMWGSQLWDSGYPDSLYFVNDFPVSSDYIDTLISGDTLLAIPEFTADIKDARIPNTDVIIGVYPLEDNTSLHASCFNGRDTLLLNVTLCPDTIKSYEVKTTDSLICVIYVTRSDNNLNIWQYDPFSNEIVNSGILLSHMENELILTNDFEFDMYGDYLCVQVPQLIDYTSSEVSNWESIVRLNFAQGAFQNIDTVFTVSQGTYYLSHKIVSDKNSFHSGILTRSTNGLTSHVYYYGSRMNVVGINYEKTVAPNLFAITGAYPNPFNPNITIEYEVEAPSMVTMNIYDIMGRRVQTLSTHQLNTGKKTFQWNATDESGNLVGTGVYFAQLNVAGSSQAEVVKILCLR